LGPLHKIEVQHKMRHKIFCRALLAEVVGLVQRSWPEIKIHKDYSRKPDE